MGSIVDKIFVDLGPTSSIALLTVAGSKESFAPAYMVVDPGQEQVAEPRVAGQRQATSSPAGLAIPDVRKSQTGFGSW